VFPELISDCGLMAAEAEPKPLDIKLSPIGEPAGEMRLGEITE
jgi:hypothetical protein